MNIFLLCLDALFDAIAITLGAILISRANDNRIKFWWGIVTLVAGTILLADDIKWMLVDGMARESANMHQVLVIPNMLKWFVMAAPISLFPLASLRPGYLTNFRVLILSIPIWSTVLTGILYYMFNGTITDLSDFQDIIANTGKLDVKLRLVIFAISIVVPISYFLFPFFGALKFEPRKSTATMWIFVLGMTLVLLYFVLFSLFINDFIFHTYGIVMTIFCIGFSLFFMYSENPFSSRVKTITTDKEPNISTSDTLFYKIQDYLARETPFVNPEYFITDLASEMNSKQRPVAEAIKSGGFTGFREYVSFLRVEHFKKLAGEQRGKSVKELMFECGFTSRSSFYRIFSGSENITPTEYIEKLYAPYNTNH